VLEQERGIALVARSGAGTSATDLGLENSGKEQVEIQRRTKIVAHRWQSTLSSTALLVTTFIVAILVHSFISPQNVIAKKQRKQDLTKLN